MFQRFALPAIFTLALVSATAAHAGHAAYPAGTVLKGWSKCLKRFSEAQCMERLGLNEYCTDTFAKLQFGAAETAAICAGVNSSTTAEAIQITAGCVSEVQARGYSNAEALDSCSI